MAHVAAAVEAAFSPMKMNIESLGNGVPHLHWWITPRHDDDPQPRSPIWENAAFVRDMRQDTGFEDAERLRRDAELLRGALADRGLVLDPDP